MLITFASSLDPDQARQKVGSDLDPNCLTLFQKSKLIVKKISRRPKCLQNFSASKELKKKSIYSQDFITLE